MHTRTLYIVEPMVDLSRRTLSAAYGWGLSRSIFSQRVQVEISILVNLKTNFSGFKKWKVKNKTKQNQKRGSSAIPTCYATGALRPTILAIVAGTLDTPPPLNQCCNQTSYVMQFAHCVHSNTTVKEGRMEIEYLKKKMIMHKCPNYFCPTL